MNGKRTLISLVLCLVLASAAASATFAATIDGDPSNEQFFEDFTGFDGSATDPGNFSISTFLGNTVLTGSTAGVGNFSGGASPGPLLYNSGTEAWIAEPADTLSVVFPTPMAVVEFYVGAVDGATINVFGQVNEAPIVAVAAGGLGIFSFSGAIDSFTLTNISIDPDLDLCLLYCASIDDLGFSPVPIPAAVWLFGSALGVSRQLLCPVWRQL